MPRSLQAYVLNADLRTSRKVTDRNAWQRELADATSAVKRRIDQRQPPEVPVARRHLQPVKGIDELVGVYEKPSIAISVAWELNLRIAPRGFRFGLGFGTIDVGLDSDRNSELDGTAFHRAADAISRAREEGLSLAISADGINLHPLQMAEMLFTLVDQTIRTWKPASLDVARAWMLREPGEVQSDIAAALGVSQQAVSKAIRRTHARQILDSLRSIEAWLTDLGQ